MIAPTLQLNPTEVRVLGSLIEKDITTPDYCPLSLNALVNACNQKNNRDPIMSLDEDSVRHALTSLQENRLAGPAGGADSRVTKYEHRLQEVFNFDRREIAIVCVLLLRGPQTPGELRSRRCGCFRNSLEPKNRVTCISLRRTPGPQKRSSSIPSQRPPPTATHVFPHWRPKSLLSEARRPNSGSSWPPSRPSSTDVTNRRPKATSLWKCA